MARVLTSLQKVPNVFGVFQGHSEYGIVRRVWTHTAPHDQTRSARLGREDNA